MIDEVGRRVWREAGPDSSCLTHGTDRRNIEPRRRQTTNPSVKRTPLYFPYTRYTGNFTPKITNETHHDTTSLVEMLLHEKRDDRPRWGSNPEPLPTVVATGK